MADKNKLGHSPTQLRVLMSLNSRFVPQVRGVLEDSLRALLGLARDTQLRQTLWFAHSSRADSQLESNLLGSLRILYPGAAELCYG